jgi:hypothetical protein
VDRFGIDTFGCRDDPGLIQVALGGRSWSNSDGLIRQGKIRSPAVGFRINDSDFDPQIPASPDHP